MVTLSLKRALAQEIRLGSPDHYTSPRERVGSGDETRPSFDTGSIVYTKASLVPSPSSRWQNDLMCQLDALFIQYVC